MNQKPHRIAASTSTLPWFRLYTEVLNDPKVQKLSDRSFRAWINLLCVATKYRGVLPEIEELAFLLRIKPAKANALIEELLAVGLLDEIDGRFEPHNWKGRQYESDNSTLRVQRFRKAKRNVSDSVSETTPDTDSDSDADSEVAMSQDTATAAAPIVANATFPVEPIVGMPGALSRGRSLIRPEAFTLAGQIAAAMGLNDGHPSTVGMPMKVEHWLTAWHPEIILTTVQAIMATRPTNPPNNLNYFEKPIARAHAEQSRSMPIAIVSPAETINVFQKNARRGGSLVAAIDRELAKLEGEEEAHLAVPANAVRRLPG
jgi:hypothetical protein